MVDHHHRPRPNQASIRFRASRTRQRKLNMAVPVPAARAGASATPRSSASSRCTTFRTMSGVLLKDATPDLLSYDWLKPHFITPDGQLRMNFQAFLVIPGPADHGRHLYRQPQARIRRVQATCRPTLEDIAAAGCRQQHRYGVVHHHLDHCGWNTPARRRPLGHLPQRPLPVRPGRTGVLAKKRDAGEAHGACRRRHPADRRRRYGRFHHPGHSITGRPPDPDAEATPLEATSSTSSAGQDAVITGDVVHHPMQLAAPNWRTAWLRQGRRRAPARRFFGLYADQPAW